MRRWNSEELEQVLSLCTTDEQRKLMLEIDDPVRWAENHFFHPDDGEIPFKAKKMFYELLRCNRKDRAARVGRQSGKTVHMVVDILYVAAHEQKAIILVFVPSKKQMSRMLDIMANMLRTSDLKASFTINKSSARATKNNEVQAIYDHQITASSGSVIRFFLMKNDPDKARGQHGTHLYIDEAEYLPEKAFPVILGMLKADPSIKIWASSTPSGFENTWFRDFCTTCADVEQLDSEEFHIPTSLEENWAELKERLEAVIFDEVLWKLEVEAEWAEPVGAVYKKDIINDAVERSMVSGVYLTSEDLLTSSEYYTSAKFLGVDWNNPQNGVRLVELCTMSIGNVIVRNEKVSYDEYTQVRAVSRIIELYDDNKYKLICVDAGYGETQLELLHNALVARGVDPDRVLHVVDSNKREEMIIPYFSPELGYKRNFIVNVSVKNLIVGLLSKYLERDLVLLQEEDLDKHGLVKEIRNFKRRGTNVSQGGFQYSGNTHSLSALQICIHGYEKYQKAQGKVAATTVESIIGMRLDDVVTKQKRERTSPIYHNVFAHNATRSRTGSLLGGRSGRSGRTAI